MGEGGNICTDIPRYRIYENGVFTKELTDVSSYWKEGYVGFLIGCSFSFEETLIKEGIEIRHISQGRNVPMFKNEYPNRSCWTIFRSYGVLHAPDDSGKLHRKLMILQ